MVQSLGSEILLISWVGAVLALVMKKEGPEGCDLLRPPLASCIGNTFLRYALRINSLVYLKC